MTNETNSESQNVDSPESAIADLLMGDTEKPNDIEDSQELEDDVETGEEEETTEDHDSDDLEEESEESTDEVDESDDAEDSTWQDVLGIEEDKIHLDDNGNVAGITTKVDGEVSVVSIPDLVAGYQLNKNNTVKSQQLSEERKVFEQQRDETVKNYQQRLQEVDALAEYMQKQLVSEYEGIDWDSLRVTDKAEYSILQSEFRDKLGSLEKIKEAIVFTNQQQIQELQNKQTEELNAYTKEQYQKMLLNNPTWEDKETFTKEMDELKSFLTNTYGFEGADFNAVRDARIIEVLKDARKLHSGKKVASQKLKKKVPKFQKSSGKPNKKVSKLDKLTKAAKSAKGANKRELQSNAVAQLLMGTK